LILGKREREREREREKEKGKVIYRIFFSVMNRNDISQYVAENKTGVSQPKVKQT